MQKIICQICQKEFESDFSLICDKCNDSLFEDAQQKSEGVDFSSEYQVNRIFDSIIIDGEPSRIESIKGSKKSLDEYELEEDRYNYFIEHKKEMEKEYFSRLIEVLEGEDKATYFCNLISNFWYKGNKGMESDEIESLKYYIHKYLDTYATTIYVHNKTIKDMIAQFPITSKDIEKILQMTSDLFDFYLKEWISTCSEFNEKSTSNIFFLRGLNLSQELEELYKEKEYISSYTLSLSIGEQFSDMGIKTNSIVRGEYGIFYKRILFFSPFIPNNDKTYPEQLEIGIIPHTNKLKIYKKNYYENLIGYELDD